MLINLIAIGIVILVPTNYSAQQTRVQKELDTHIDSKDLQIQVGLDAIAEIHRVLDDDKNGAVDSLESEDFIREDLSINDDEQEDQRQLSLHRGDNSISVGDMQNNWLNSQVHNWTSDDVEKWLQEVVGLPQYLPVFRKIGVDGNFLPRLALNTDQMIQSQLGITDLNHKNKLILKAMDVVLFGPPTVFYNPLKDALLALAILVAISGLFFSTVQRKKAQVQIDNMLKELDSLQFNEQKFLEIENVLQEAEQKRENVLKEKKNLEKKLKSEIDLAKAEAERLSEERSGTEAEVRRLQLAEEELAQVRSALNNAESKRFDYTRHRELQKHLKVTYKKERQQYNIKKVAAEKQLEEAKQWGLKMKKKKTGMISSLKMIHGNSLEVVENRICNARTSLIDATNDLQELFARWRRIESICNFNITSAEDTEFGSSASLVSENSNNSSPEPAMIRSNSSPTKQFTSSLPRGQSSCPATTPRGSSLKDSLGFKTSSLKSKEKKKKSRPDHHGSFPNLFTSSNQQEIKLPNGPSNLHRNYSSNMIKDITKVKELTNGHVDSTDSDDSSKWERRRKGKTLWRLVRESRINSDPKWKNLMDSCSAEGI